MSKGLEALELLEEDECYTLREYNDCYNAIRKELKALEILKDTFDFDFEEDRNVYYLVIYLNGWVCKKILKSKNEYDLLKEVLL